MPSVPMQLETLRRIVQEVDAMPSLHEALETMVELVAEAMDADVCSVYLLDERNQRYVLMASKGLNANAVGEVSLAKGEGLVGLVGQREEIINLDDAASHPRFFYLPETGEERYNAFLGIPIMYRRKVMGVMVVQHRDRKAFSEASESFLVTLCAQLSGAIAHAHAVGQVDVFRKPSSTPSAKTFQGIAGAGGIAIGRGVVLYPPADIDLIPDRQAEDPADELRLLQTAVKQVRIDIADLDHKMQDSLMDEERALFGVYLRMLDDNALPAEIAAKIRGGSWAQGAVRSVIEEHAAHFAQMDDEYLRERVSDLRDLGRRILAKLQASDSQNRDIAEDSILLGEEISTATLVELPLNNIAAIVTTEGAANSHMVIVARALGIPTVVGVTELPITQLDDAEIVVDAHQGRVFVHPVRRLRQRYREVQREEQQAAKDLKVYENRDTVTLDGQPIALYVNTGLMIDVVRGSQRGAEGVGLYRSEMLFMLRERFPGEEEQRLIYRQQLSHFANKPVIMRTLDIGADKDLPYFSIEEENSALGWRGIRFTLDHPEIFSAQIRAMLKASIGLNNLHILLPMITTVTEVEEAMYLIERALSEVQEEEQVKIARPKIGVMIEVPSVLFQIDDMASLVDFFSVGSNDLTQYLLAVDRNNPRVAGLYNQYHPAILRALSQVVTRCQAAGKTVSVCGEMAGDPSTAILLAAMGFSALSMSAANLLKVRKALCNIDLASAQVLLDDVLQMDNPAVIRSWIERYMIQKGLTDLVRPVQHHYSQ